MFTNHNIISKKLTTSKFVLPANSIPMANFAEMINGDKPVLVDFFAEWCGPCKMMAPILTQVKSEIGDKASIIKVDIDKNRNAANAYNVQSVPTLILFKKGKQVWRESGVVQLGELKRVIESNS